MGTVVQLINNMKQLTPQRMERLLLLAIKQNEKALADFNRAQLMDGEDSVGLPVALSYASIKYAEFKLSLDPKGVVDLKLKGNFHSSIFVKADDFPIIFAATDSKAPKLLAEFGDDVLGIQKSNLRLVIRNQILPDYLAIIRGNLRI